VVGVNRMEYRFAAGLVSRVGLRFVWSVGWRTAILLSSVYVRRWRLKEGTNASPCAQGSSDFVERDDLISRYV
jgi:hypothetical protein